MPLFCIDQALTCLVESCLDVFFVLCLDLCSSVIVLI